MAYRSFYRDVKIVRLKAPEDAWNGATVYPATTYIDEGDFKHVEVHINMGAMTGPVTFSLMENTASTGGTLDVVDATYAKLVFATANADKCAIMHVDTEHLADGHSFIALKQTGGGAADYGDALFLLHGAKTLPVTQPTSQYPTGYNLDLSG